MTITSDPSFLRSLISHETYPIDLLDDPRRTRSIALVRESLAVDGGAVMRDFLSPFGLKCMLLIAADHVVRRKLRYDRQRAPHP